MNKIVKETALFLGGMTIGALSKDYVDKKNIINNVKSKFSNLIKQDTPKDQIQPNNLTQLSKPAKNNVTPNNSGKKQIKKDNVAPNNQEKKQTKNKSTNKKK